MTGSPGQVAAPRERLDLDSSPFTTSLASHVHHHPRRRLHPERRRRAAVHFLLPPARLHRAPRARLRARAVAGREGRDRADPDQLAHVRGGPPPDLPGHRHRQHVPQGGHGRALGHEAQPRRAWSTRACAARTSIPDNKLRASVVDDPLFARKNTKDNTPAVFHVELVPGDEVEVTVAAKGGGSENKSKFVMLNPSDSIVDWVLKTVPTMGAGWCPPGMLGIGVGGTAEKAMLLAKESLMDPIDMHELLARGPREQARGAAHRAVREGQRARHRRAGSRRPHDRARREDPHVSRRTRPRSRSR